ncbi:Translation initiation factor 2, alpha subunit, C-terminal [Cynara cardunculus var. scolymus]|uniref:Translation initiation factor 2, alpha subunit, C-terminal n=1 Tax=Cynara cardunculus var. scolymus TaxID=59895 RepID=A0A103YK13_CYNCS|nr:Translation initiation factor 2, alpha subunit, C-terminal [Cynara cardunculus var. scolymus]
MLLDIMIVGDRAVNASELGLDVEYYILLAFKSIVNDPDYVLKSLTCVVREIGSDGKEVAKVVPDISEDVKEALEAMRQAEAVGTKDWIRVLPEAIAACAVAIERHEGKLTIKESPRAVSEWEDKLLAEQMAKLECQNAEVSGDEDSEVEEDTGMGSSFRVNQWHLLSFDPKK